MCFPTQQRGTVGQKSHVAYDREIQRPGSAKEKCCQCFLAPGPRGASPVLNVGVRSGGGGERERKGVVLWMKTMAIPVGEGLADSSAPSHKVSVRGRD